MSFGLGRNQAVVGEKFGECGLHVAPKVVFFLFVWSSCSRMWCCR